MTGELGYSLPPAIRRIAANFKRVGWASVWIQVVVGVIASILFIFNALEPNAGFTSASADLFTTIGLLTIFISAFWGFRYVLLGRKLSTTNPDLRPKPKDAIRAIRIGISISLIGMLITIFGAEVVIADLWTRSLRQVAIGVTTQDSSAFINAADIAVVFSVINAIFAHYIGLCASIWLEYVTNRQ
ncbi:DUF3611 family protein [cf. Phormidesmis sp. LEGE 11477]|uniref:DUF3611 family protein n=1 Tax=cf. Phormidesmis sp. LEGE 11477 TaxID=1828680 RepID=UPI00187E7B3B|nr:DUF3611 family protein [cf. Phormidesmis sp. LEGE 11477]MBE9060005.1 DUF3611 family protein [cf. Phormidesmis sp. LEGE 11477]